MSVTGVVATGRIGRLAVEHARAAGHQVTAVARFMLAILDRPETIGHAIGIAA